MAAGLSATGADGIRRRSAALRQLHVWMLRGNAPLSVCSTFQILTLCASGTENTPVEQVGGGGALEHRRLALAMALVRLVNGLADSGQKGMFASSVYDIAAQLRLPRTLVDLRHESTHGAMPSWPMLRSAADAALAWLWDAYWRRQRTHLAITIYDDYAAAAEGDAASGGRAQTGVPQLLAAYGAAVSGGPAWLSAATPIGNRSVAATAGSARRRARGGALVKSDPFVGAGDATGRVCGDSDDDAGELDGPIVVVDAPAAERFASRASAAVASFGANSSVDAMIDATAAIFALRGFPTASPAPTVVIPDVAGAIADEIVARLSAHVARDTDRGAAWVEGAIVGPLVRDEGLLTFLRGSGAFSQPTASAPHDAAFGVHEVASAATAVGAISVLPASRVGFTCAAAAWAPLLLKLVRVFPRLTTYLVARLVDATLARTLSAGASLSALQGNSRSDSSGSSSGLSPAAQALLRAKTYHSTAWLRFLCSRHWVALADGGASWGVAVRIVRQRRVADGASAEKAVSHMSSRFLLLASPEPVAEPLPAPKRRPLASQLQLRSASWSAADRGFMCAPAPAHALTGFVRAPHATARGAGGATGGGGRASSRYALDVDRSIALVLEDRVRAFVSARPGALALDAARSLNSLLRACGLGDVTAMHQAIVLAGNRMDGNASCRREGPHEVPTTPVELQRQASACGEAAQASVTNPQLDMAGEVGGPVAAAAAAAMQPPTVKSPSQLPDIELRSAGGDSAATLQLMDLASMEALLMNPRTTRQCDKAGPSNDSDGAATENAALTAPPNISTEPVNTAIGGVHKYSTPRWQRA